MLPLIVSLAFLAVQSLERAAPADFTTYVEEIRAAGATEFAQSDLEGTAAVLVGQTIVDFPMEDDGTYMGMSYRSSVCPPPGLSAADREKWEENVSTRRRPVLERLKHVADADHSGFVSTAEGRRLRRDIEFGLKATFVSKNQGSADPARLCVLLGMKAEDFQSSLDRYEGLRKQLAGMNADLLRPIPMGQNPKNGNGR
jgi:hypothetical protein